MCRTVVLVGLLAFIAPSIVRRADRPPRYVVLHVAGVDLLHAGQEGIVRRLGRTQAVRTDQGRALRYRDRVSGSLLEFVIDDESGAIRSVRAAVEGSAAPAADLRVPRPLTGNGLSLGDPASTVERALGKPHRRLDGRSQASEWVYRLAMRADGSLPAYEGRWRFVGGRLAAFRLRIGE